MDDVACPFCERTFQAGLPGTWWAVAAHLADTHCYTAEDYLDSPPNGLVRWSPEVVSCFCGKAFRLRRGARDEPDDFGRHLREKGGPVAHLIALGFNLPEGQ